MSANSAKSTTTVYLDLTHAGRHVTGLERVALEQFAKVTFENARVVPIRASGVFSMVWRQQVVLPVLAALKPTAHFIFPGFPPSPLFALARKRVLMYVHDTFLITRKRDLSAKARLYMAPQFAFALRHLRRFMVNSEKTLAEMRPYTADDADIRLYRPSVANVFQLDAGNRDARRGDARPLRLVTLGTIEPRKNYAAAVAILDALRAEHTPDAELHIIGRQGWGEDGARIATHPGVTVHGYLEAASVKAVLEGADAYLCTSHDEGLGLPLLEAQYAGLPVIAPDAPVFREVLGASGTFIAPSDAAASAQAVLALMEEPGWRDAAAKAALHNVARWNALAAADLAKAQRTFAPEGVKSASGGVTAGVTL